MKDDGEPLAPAKLSWKEKFHRAVREPAFAGLVIAGWTLMMTFTGAWDSETRKDLVSQGIGIFIFWALPIGLLVAHEMQKLRERKRKR